MTYLESAQPQSLARCLQGIADRFTALVPELQETAVAIQPINAVAAEFSRSIQAALVEHGLTIAQLAAQQEIELTCLVKVSNGQKVPGEAIAASLAAAGLLKDADGNLYKGEDLLSLVEQAEALEAKPVDTKKPPQKKRLKLNRGQS